MHHAQARIVRSSTHRRLGALGAIAAAGALVLAGGQAAGAASSDSEITVHHVEQTAAASSGAYWTPERMEAATPADVLADPAASTTPVATGAPSETHGHGAGGQANPSSSGHGASPQASEVPVSTIGKVFFTLGGVDYVCSGNAIASDNESTVATAGHCVNEGPGAFATNWVFAPAYEGGETPYGTWTATDLVAPTSWANDGDISYDTGFAVVSGDSSATLTDTVGASGVAFNQSTGLDYTAYGYPAASPFDGESLESCTGVASADPFGQSDSQGIDCDMTGGSSGGPWFIGSGSDGLQNSINSFGYSSVSDTMFGPYWGSVIESAYEQAQA